MKRWLTIFLLVWSTATLCSAGENHRDTPLRTELQARTISNRNDSEFETNHTPLLCTAACDTAHLSEAGQTSTGRYNRHANVPHAARSCHIRTQELLWSRSENDGHPVPTPSLRTADRYIYYLRRIVI